MVDDEPTNMEILDTAGQVRYPIHPDKFFFLNLFLTFHQLRRNFK